MTKKVCMIVTNGFEEIEAIGTYAILRRGGLDVDIYSLAGSEATGRFGVTCAKLTPFNQIDTAHYDALVIPGGRDFMDTGRITAAICAGPTILGRAGYLKGRKYTCFTAMNQDFGGIYQEDYAVKDGNVITGKSAAATIDFAFMVLEAVAGKETADQTKKEIYYK